VTDTPAEVEAMYRRMLLAHSGADRLQMGFSMYSTARALVVASILQGEPQASPERIREAVFLRFYGRDFDAATREQILARLVGERPPRRRVPINWDDLEIALTWRRDEWTSYLDLRTGEVRVCRSGLLGDEGEGWELSEEEADAGLANGQLVYIEPLSSSVESNWMAEFAASTTAPGLRDRLERALLGRGAFRRFKDVLAGYPREREQWFAFRNARTRGAMREWLGEHDVEATTALPEQDHRQDE
jgi:Uncharacterised protein family (UPF0158)